MVGGGGSKKLGEAHSSLIKLKESAQEFGK